MATDAYDSYRRAWRHRRYEAQQDLRKRAQSAREAAEVCARLLVERYGARRVYLFGSLLDRKRFHQLSDVDLAVEGLGPGRLYWRALAEVWEHLPRGIELNLIPLEESRPELVARILKEGELLDADRGLCEPTR